MFLDLQMDYSKPQDIWQLGNLIYELANHTPAYPIQEVNCFVERIFNHTATTEDPIYLRINENGFARIPSHYSQELWKLVQKCLNADPKKRPTVE